MQQISTQFFIIALISGLMLIGAEIFVPGGILGVMGGVALFAAVVAAFHAFGPTVGGYILVGIVILVGVAIYLWIKIFPKTRIGQKMTVSNDLADFKSADPALMELIGKNGTSSSPLRPAGYAVIEGRRVDVVTRGEMIAKGENVEVVKVEGNRVIVGKIGN